MLLYLFLPCKIIALDAICFNLKTDQLCYNYLCKFLF